MDSRKKKVAAISAVISYIKTEKEVFSMQPAVVTDRQVSLSLWSVSGRQSLMRMRNLMQMKAFHGVRRTIR
jgi:hypothetical protein